MNQAILETAMHLAIQEAEKYRGATSPNPPVGAAALDVNGRILAVAAHNRAGEAHAEAALLRILEERDQLHLADTLVVTLEPCTHHGRTPPCVDAILRTSIPRIVIGAKDPNPVVSGRGILRLIQEGLEVRAGVLENECKRLIGPFSKWITEKRPWVTLKRALDPSESMIPPPGRKTFTSRDSLVLAHLLRRRADAILTGSGTVLADLPEFTVRHVEDHPGKIRWLVVMGSSGLPRDWLSQVEARGFRLHRSESIDEALAFLGEQGVLEVLVEAGPTLSGEFLRRRLWDEDVVIRRSAPVGLELVGEDEVPDSVEFRYRTGAAGPRPVPRPEERV